MQKDRGSFEDPFGTHSIPLTMKGRHKMMFSNQRSPQRSRVALRIWICTLSTGLATLVALSGCASTLELTSRWDKGEIKIDGQSSDWENSLYYVSSSNASVGVRNDKDFLYICLITPDRSTQMQIIGMGLTVWLDSEGKGKKNFGIRFPLGRMSGGRPVMRPGANANPEEMQRMLELAQRELEILASSEDQRHRLVVMQAPGIGAKLGFSQGTLVYELKVPQVKSSDHPFAIGQNDFQILSVGFETTPLSAEAPRDRANMRGGRGAPGGRSGGRGSSQPTGDPAEGGDGRPERPQAFKLWTNVQLASSSK